MNLYPDTPDTTRFLASFTTPAPGLVSSTWHADLFDRARICMCDPTTGASCRNCTGEAAEEREMRRLPRRDREALETANARLALPAVLRDDREQGAA